VPSGENLGLLGEEELALVKLAAQFPRTVEAAAVEAVGKRAIAIVHDITRLDQASALVERVTREVGPITSLVNNAGNAPARSVEQMTVDEWRQANGKDPLPGGRGQVLYIPFSAVVTPVNQLGGGGGDEKEEGGKASKGLSDEQKTAIWWVFEKSAVKLEANFKRVMKNFFQEQQDTVNAKLEQLLGDKSVRKDIDNIIEMLLAWAAENDKLKGVLKPAWLAGWKEGWKVVEGTFSLGINFDLLNPRFLFWLDEYGADQVKNINETTKDALRDELVEGLASGESVPKLRDRVSRVFSDAKGRRAETIARTESHNSVSAGTFETYRAADVEKKSWLSTRDMRTRDSHRAIDGEIRELHESFK